MSEVIVVGGVELIEGPAERNVFGISGARGKFIFPQEIHRFSTDNPLPRDRREPSRPAVIARTHAAVLCRPLDAIFQTGEQRTGEPEAERVHFEAIGSGALASAGESAFAVLIVPQQICLEQRPAPEVGERAVNAPDAVAEHGMIEVVRLDLDGRDQKRFDARPLGGVRKPRVIVGPRAVAPLGRADQPALAVIEHHAACRHPEAGLVLGKELEISFLQIGGVAHGVRSRLPVPGSARVLHHAGDFERRSFVGEQRRVRARPVATSTSFPKPLPSRDS